MSSLPVPNHLLPLPSACQGSLQPLPLPEASLDLLPEPPQDVEGAAGGGQG